MKKSVITWVMEPVVPDACVVMTIGGGIKNRHIFARRIADGKRGTPLVPVPLVQKANGKNG